MFEIDNPMDDVLNPIIETLTNVTMGINSLLFNIFYLGNYILFFVFLGLGLNLLNSAKESENYQKLYGRNLEYVRKHGRAGAFFCIILSIGFLFRGFNILFLYLFPSVPPPIYAWLNWEHLYSNTSSLGQAETSELTVFEIFFVYLFCLISLLALIFLSVGAYLIIYNKKVLHSKYKPLNIFLLGLFGAIIFGIAPALSITMP